MKNIYKGSEETASKKIENGKKLDLLNQSYEGVLGVKEIDSGIEGPNVCISVCTHGGEHAGLKAIEYIYESLNIKQELIKGKIYFILTNVEAYKKSLKDNNSNPVDSRFIDENLNRCCDMENMSSSISYEVKRVLELSNILGNIDFHLDIHSTYSKTEAMLITTEKGFKNCSDIFNVDAIYSGLTEVQVGKPLIDIVERNGGIGIGLEAGCENDNTGYNIGIENSIRLLKEFGMITGKIFNKELTGRKKNVKIKVYGSIIVDSILFKPVKNFNHNDLVKKGEIIATIGDKDIIAERDTIILLPSAKVIVGEEYCFLGDV